MHGGHRQRNPLGPHPLPTNFVATRHHPPAIPRSLLSTSSLRPQDTPPYDRRPSYQSNWDRNNNSDSREQRGNGPFSSSSTTPTRPAPLAATDECVPPAKRLRVQPSEPSFPSNAHTTTVHENSSSSSSNYYTRSDMFNSAKRRYDDATYDPRRDPSPKRQFINPNPPPNHRPTPESPALPPRSHYHQHSSEKHHQNPSHHASQSIRHPGYGRGRRSRSRSRSRSRKRSRSTTSEDESTSEGESESEEDDIMVARESVLMNPLRTQGEIHDLLFSLERNRTRYARATDRVKAISRTIQRTSRRLERKVRILAENMVAPPLPSPTVPKPDYMAVVAPDPSPPTTQRTPLQQEPEISTRERERERERERVQLPKPTTSVLAVAMPQTSKRSVPLPPQRKPSSNGAVTITSTSTSSSVAAMRIDTVVTAPRRDSSSSSASTSSTSSSIPSPTTPKQSSRHGPRNSVSSSIPVSQLDTCDVLFSPNKYVKTKAFTRKPRSLLFNVSKDSGSLMNDLMTTSSLDGEIQFWTSSSRCILSSVSKGRLRMPWAEDMCWVTENTLAIGAAQKEGNRDPCPVGLVHVEDVSRARVTSRIQHLTPRPHDKYLSVIAPVIDGVSDGNGGQRMSFVTGGTDKIVVHWELTRDTPTEDFRVISTSPLPIRHTSVVHALCYDRQRGVLYTGGADSKYFGWNVERDAQESEGKLNERVNHILQNPADPKLLLFSLSSKSNQLGLFDIRDQGQGFTIQFGFSQHENLSRYIAPCWHGNGYLVACGSQSEGKLHFWDIRYTGVKRGPAISFDAHERRVLRALFLPGRNTVVSMSTDCSIAFTDYSVRTDSVVR